MTKNKDDEKETLTFLGEIDHKIRQSLQLELDSFVVQHATAHRPVALVTSGGTAADLENQSVRCIDNFSTGLRGAIAVEQLLQRGYAVVHLSRKGSAEPFARALSQYLGLQQANHGLDVQSLERLFAFGDTDVEDELVKAVLEQEQDPFLTNPSSSAAVRRSKASENDGVRLNRALLHSKAVRNAVFEQRAAMVDGRLLSISFRTVEDYLGRLQLCAESLRDAQSLVMIFLAAAVSDFYVPAEGRVEHKIQSDGEDLVLTLKPVPKVIEELRQKWCPDAFVVTFKLETDTKILKEKAARAVERYGCHMVIGNLLKSRHNKVWILSPPEQREKHPTCSSDWNFDEIVKPSSDTDSLETALMEVVIQSHFEFISLHFQRNLAGVQAAQDVHTSLANKKRVVQRQLFRNHARNVGIQCIASALAFFFSYQINSQLQRRIQSRR